MRFFPFLFEYCVCCFLYLFSIENRNERTNMKIVFLCKNISFRISFDSIIFSCFYFSFAALLALYLNFLFRNFCFFLVLCVFN